GNAIRGWGTLASASEYALYLGAGVIFAVAALFQRRYWPVLLLPLLTVAILFSSVRTTLVLVIVAVLVVLGLRSRRPRIVLPAVILGGLIGYVVGAPALTTLSANSGSALVSHQVEGIAHPFNPHDSSVAFHIAIVKGGFVQGLKNPIGQGIAP